MTKYSIAWWQIKAHKSSKVYTPGLSRPAMNITSCEEHGYYYASLGCPGCACNRCGK